MEVRTPSGAGKKGAQPNDGKPYVRAPQIRWEADAGPITIRSREPRSREHGPSSPLTLDFTARAIGVKNERYSQGCPESSLIGRELVDATNVKTSEVDVAMTCRYEGC